MLSNCGAGEDSWESPLDYKEIKPVNPKGNQSWIFIGRTDAEAATLILQAPDGKSQLSGKDSCWERLRAGEGVTEDEMVGWHHPLTSKKLRTMVNFVQISSKFLSNLSFKIQTPSHHSDKSELNPAHKPSHSNRKRATQGVPISPLYRVSL